MDSWTGTISSAVVFGWISIYQMIFISLKCCRHVKILDYLCCTCPCHRKFAEYNILSLVVQRRVPILDSGLFMILFNRFLKILVALNKEKAQVRNSVKLSAKFG